jgi:hypothetical protein
MNFYGAPSSFQDPGLIVWSTKQGSFDPTYVKQQETKRDGITEKQDGTAGRSGRSYPKKQLSLGEWGAGRELSGQE